MTIEFKKHARIKSFNERTTTALTDPMAQFKASHSSTYKTHTVDRNRKKKHTEYPKKQTEAVRNKKEQNTYLNCSKYKIMQHKESRRLKHLVS